MRDVEVSDYEDEDHGGGESVGSFMANKDKPPAQAPISLDSANISLALRERAHPQSNIYRPFPVSPMPFHLEEEGEPYTLLRGAAVTSLVSLSV